jgi:hypothetical protein
MNRITKTFFIRGQCFEFRPPQIEIIKRQKSLSSEMIQLNNLDYKSRLLFCTYRLTIFVSPHLIVFILVKQDGGSVRDLRKSYIRNS